MAEGDRILVVDDEKDMLQNYQRMIQPWGYECLTAAGGQKAIELIRKEMPGLVLTDLRMPGKDGLEVLRAAKTIDRDIVVILITAYATIDTAVQAIKEGAFDYLQKPFTSEQLRNAIQKGLDQRRRLRSGPLRASPFQEIVGQSPAIQQVFQLIAKVADSEANILLTGETGTGKELFARYLHHQSRRARKAFVPIDCSSLPESLLESELFGYEKGAFTGAHISRPGLLELAQGGSIFFDEIAELKPDLQVKLLRVIQERTYRRIGGREWISLDVRILSATNRDLNREVAQERFREDLFYRLNVVQVALPPMRERKEDIPLLAQHFLVHFGRSGRSSPSAISPEAMERLARYPWPGNIRELQNAIERAVSVCEGGVIRPQDLPEPIRVGPIGRLPFQPKVDLPFKEAKELWIASFEREYLSQLLREQRGNISRAAQQAGIDRKTIHRLIRKYGLKD
ncbi:MAG: sigma-54-dependent Fis family transcriptional regulator [Nitrospinae bacterium]|nr:sigma-54-dependent Fis family transcriptional regulator [Nitrospinota bacterium]